MVTLLLLVAAGYMRFMILGPGVAATAPLTVAATVALLLLMTGDASVFAVADAAVHAVPVACATAAAVLSRSAGLFGLSIVPEKLPMTTRA